MKAYIFYGQTQFGNTYILLVVKPHKITIHCCTYKNEISANKLLFGNTDAYAKAWVKGLDKVENTFPYWHKSTGLQWIHYTMDTAVKPHVQSRVLKRYGYKPTDFTEIITL